MSSIQTTLVERPTSFAAVSKLRAAGLPELLARLYAARGVKHISEVRGTYDDLLPIDSLKNARVMANYLADCAVRGTRVLIVSDYDCDGATACAVLTMAFMGCSMNSGYLVPDRKIHGYGLTPAIVEEAAALDPKPEVIITVDAGISSIDGVKRAAELGIEVLITDHHLAPAVLPDAKIIVNPNQPGCEFESKNIAGCGVAWYVARALIEELIARNMDPGFSADELLCYVALGTVADVVKLDRNNRILVAQGLGFIRSGQCPPGIQALARVSKKNPAMLSCVDIGFGLGPRINAAGRLADMSVGIELLTTLDDYEAERLAHELDETNEERKSIQKDIANEAVLQAVKLINLGAGDDRGRRSLVVFNEDWHEGVVGVVAGRLKEERHRPVCVMTRAADGSIKGSARSIQGYHLKHALDSISVNPAHAGLLLKYGGHAAAAGCSIEGTRFEEFKDAFEAACKFGLTDEMMNKTLLHDGALPERFLDAETLESLSQEVWGQGFEAPVFMNEIEVTEVKTMGKAKEHLKLIAKVGDTPVDAVAFFQGDLASGITNKMTVVHRPGLNEFRGAVGIQFLVELMPESVNPSLSDSLRAREANEAEKVAAETPVAPMLQGSAWADAVVEKIRSGGKKTATPVVAPISAAVPSPVAEIALESAGGSVGVTAGDILELAAGMGPISGVVVAPEARRASRRFGRGA